MGDQPSHAAQRAVAVIGARVDEENRVQVVELRAVKASAMRLCRCSDSSQSRPRTARTGVPLWRRPRPIRAATFRTGKRDWESGEATGFRTDSGRDLASGRRGVGHCAATSCGAVRPAPNDIEGDWHRDRDMRSNSERGGAGGGAFGFQCVTLRARVASVGHRPLRHARHLHVGRRSPHHWHGMRLRARDERQGKQQTDYTPKPTPAHAAIMSARPAPDKAVQGPRRSITPS